MSLLNAVVRDDVGWLCVDTTTRVENDGSFSQQSKMLPLVHVNAVVGCRGDVTFLSSILYAFMDTPTKEFDALAGSWQQRLREAMEHYRDRAEREGFDPHKYGSHVVLLGWSNARDKPLGMVACRQDGGDSFVGGEIATFSIGPDPGHPVSDVPDLQVMQSLAREQVSKVWHDHPGEPIGGRLLLAEVRCAQMAIRELATLG